MKQHGTRREFRWERVKHTLQNDIKRGHDAAPGCPIDSGVLLDQGWNGIGRTDGRTDGQTPIMIVLPYIAGGMYGTKAHIYLGNLDWMDCRWRTGQRERCSRLL